MSVVATLRHQFWTSFREDLFRGDLPKRWEEDVALYLFGRGYRLDQAARVLEHAGDHGSVEDCAELATDDVDRRRVEQLLPDAPPGNWYRFNRYVWASIETAAVPA